MRVKIAKIMGTLAIAVLLAGGTTEVLQAESIPDAQEVEATGAWYTTGYCGENAKWRFDWETGCLTISGTGALESGWVYDDTFSGREKVKKLIINEGITEIGYENFYHMKCLESVSLPKSLKKIGAEAFSFCESLQEISIPDGITEIGNSTFYACKSLKTVKLPQSVANIEIDAFGECVSLKNIELPDYLNLIRWSAFNNCASLEKIKISAKSISQYSAFRGCKKLKSIELTNRVESIGEEAFYGLPITELIIPESVTYICESGTFTNCSNLKKLVIKSKNVRFGMPLTNTVSLFQNCNPDLVVYGYSYTKVPVICKKYGVKFEALENKSQKITASNYTKRYGDKSFKLNAKLLKGTGTLTYSSDNKKVAIVDKKTGKVTIKGTGKAVITVTVSASGDYKQTFKKITITVKPKKNKINSLKSTAKKSITVAWNKDSKANGYVVEYSTKKSFKNAKSFTVNKNTIKNKKITGVRSKKTYYVRVRSYIKVSGKKIFGDWSSSKKVRTK